MYEYLCQHPLVVRGKRRETHYFDWRFNHQLPWPATAGTISATSACAAAASNESTAGSELDATMTTAAATDDATVAAAAAHLKYYMNFFYADALEKHISLTTGESTPSYLLHR